MIRHQMTARETIGATLAGLSMITAEPGDVRMADLSVERGRIHDTLARMLRASALVGDRVRARCQGRSRDLS